MKISDTHIFQEIRKGNNDAFTQLFDEFYPPLCFFANKYLSDLDLSRSLVQEFFVDLWGRREKLNVQFSIKSYLYHSVKNRSIDYLRKEKKTIPVGESGDVAEAVPFRDLIEEAELNNRINLSIQQLPEKCRQVFVLCRFEDLKYTEIAEKLEISVKTVEMQMGIALKKLRKSLSDYQFINLLSFIYTKKR